MNNCFYIERSSKDLIHYGVLGMKWGVRRYQNPDGSLTREGRQKYLKGTTKSRIAGAVIGGLLPFNGLTSLIVGQKAYEHQLKRNMEQVEREQEREQVSKMSDKELNEFNYRKSLERQLSDILTKENEIMGEDYVSDVINTIKGGANLIKNVSDISVSISTPTEKQKKENKAKEKEQMELRINNLNAQRKAIKKETISNSKKNGTKDSLNERLESIDKKFDNAIKAEKDASNDRIRNYNKAILANSVNKMINTDIRRLNSVSASIQDIAKLYKSGADIDTSNMSIKDLQKLVDRTRAEQQYLNVVTPVNTSSGMKYVADVANTAASIAGVASTEIRSIRRV